MARRRKGFQPTDLGEVNQILTRIQTTLPVLLEDLGDETEELPEFGPLVVSLHTFSMWLRRIRLLTDETQAAARLHILSLVDELFYALKEPRARRLDIQLRARLASLSKLLISLSRRP